MSVFNIGYTNLIIERFIESTDMYNESQYAIPEIISGVIYGNKKYTRNVEEEEESSGYICQTLENVGLKDKINGYIVTEVNKHYNIFGGFDYYEISLVEG